MSKLTRRLSIESLEGREVPATLSLNQGLLTMTGDHTSETVRLYEQGNYLMIEMTSSTGSTSSMEMEQIPLSRVKAVAFLGNGGNDALLTNVSSRVMIGANGGAGNDYLRSYGNNVDVFQGGTGNDTLYGGSATDELYGNDGNDVIYGEGGNDRLYGNVGNDRIFGGTGNDAAWGGGGNDALYGDAGNDRLYGETGEDRIFGGIGNDALYGQQGNDAIYGEAGNDYMDGGDRRERNVAHGGSGADQFNQIASSMMPDYNRGLGDSRTNA